MIGLENQLSVFFRVAVLDRFYCILKLKIKGMMPKPFQLQHKDGFFRVTNAIWDRRIAIFRITRVRHFIFCSGLVQQTGKCPAMTEKVLTGTKSINTNKLTQFIRAALRQNAFKQVLLYH